MANGNLDRLVEAQVIPSAEALSAAERTVIDGLSEEEVACLVGIRRKLSDATAARRPALTDADEKLDSGLDLEQQFKSNIVI
jgi:hypothetical protein